ncbi:MULTISPECIES: hypothetical protein [Methylobacter]
MIMETNWDYLSLTLAAKNIDCAEGAFIDLCNKRSLRLFIDQTNLVFVDDDDVQTPIAEPILVDDPSLLEKLVRGEESFMFTSSDRPDDFIWDLGCFEIAMFDNNHELSSEQTEKLMADGSLSVHRDEVSTGLGVVLSYEKLLILRSDFERLEAHQGAIKRRNFSSAIRELEFDGQDKLAQLQVETIGDGCASRQVSAEPQSESTVGDDSEGSKSVNEPGSDNKNITRKQIKLIFDKISSEQWRGHFGREDNNGLLEIRFGETGKPKYPLHEISKWLTDKALYTEAGIQSAIKKYYELPRDNIQVTKPSPKKQNIGDEMTRMSKI